jgi:hypothetical protein
MRNIRSLLGWLVVVTLLHVVEQILFGAQELFEPKRLLAGYYRWFRDPDEGTVVLLGVAMALIQWLVYAVLIGGKPRLFAVGFFAVYALSEGHHLVTAVNKVSYVPGAATAALSVTLGFFLLRAIVREFRRYAWG